MKKGIRKNREFEEKWNDEEIERKPKKEEKYKRKKSVQRKKSKERKS